MRAILSQNSPTAIDTNNTMADDYQPYCTISPSPTHIQRSSPLILSSGAALDDLSRPLASLKNSEQTAFHQNHRQRERVGHTITMLSHHHRYFRDRFGWWGCIIVLLGRFRLWELDYVLFVLMIIERGEWLFIMLWYVPFSSVDSDVNVAAGSFSIRFVKGGDGDGDASSLIFVLNRVRCVKEFIYWSCVLGCNCISSSFLNNALHYLWEFFLYHFNISSNYCISLRCSKPPGHFDEMGTPSLCASGFAVFQAALY